MTSSDGQKGCFVSFGLTKCVLALHTTVCLPHHDDVGEVLPRHRPQPEQHVLHVPPGPLCSGSVTVHRARLADCTRCHTRGGEEEERIKGGTVPDWPTASLPHEGGGGDKDERGDKSEG